jgi:hypothetical protein
MQRAIHRQFQNCLILGPQCNVRQRYLVQQWFRPAAKHIPTQPGRCQLLYECTLETKAPSNPHSDGAILIHSQVLYRNHRRHLRRDVAIESRLLCQHYRRHLLRDLVDGLQWKSQRKSSACHPMAIGRSGACYLAKPLLHRPETWHLSIPRLPKIFSLNAQHASSIIPMTLAMN